MIAFVFISLYLVWDAVGLPSSVTFPALGCSLLESHFNSHISSCLPPHGNF